MDILVRFTVEVEGECPDAKKMFFENMPLAGSVILSEDVDGTEDWAITISGCELVE